MLFRVPIYVTATHEKGTYLAHPLFFPDVVETNDNLNRLISKLARVVVQAIENLGKSERQDQCAAWSFNPPLTQHRLSLNIDLRRRTAKVKYLFIVFKQMGKRIAFTPAIPDLWFEVGRNTDLTTRATTVVGDYFRQLERDETDEIKPEELNLRGKAWVQVLELSANPPTFVKPTPKFQFLSLGSEEEMDGTSELRRVGRCLDWLYPDELERALHRTEEVAELTRLLASQERRPILLLGPRQVGKTTVIHECVYERVHERKSPFVNRENTWLIAPQRLISGMSFVGQWEARLLAILKHAKKRNHVLYFDDLVGLFLAGVSSSSTLSAAQVLKPYLERRDVQVLGEITPEAFRVLQERDRSFADLFHVLPVREPSDEVAQRILIGVQRRLEGKLRCGFALDVLPTVVDLQRRYERTAVFPGKAARMLNRLALKAEPTKPLPDGSLPPFEPKTIIHREHVLNDFRGQSGLSLDFLDRRSKLERAEVLKALQAQVVGQDDALQAAADVIGIAKARLNDPDRPLAAFLFLGPTGVGKTECAKAVARYLFSDADRLLRFDMNEYVNPGSATRLVGTFAQPEGLLTAAIRRQPFAVVLLDEIEKADPEVFDLLLQVLGEGRLTDALGRTADFTNALIILTSNLGVRESEAQVGFTESSAKAAENYIRAAERFFRPEFFNRLDRVLPFKRLTRDHIRAIAKRLVGDVLAREGFRQRQCILNVAMEALERVIDKGYDPVLGARAMKRAIERELTQPAAAKLAELPLDRFTIVNVATEGPALKVAIQSLEQVPPLERHVPEGTPLEQLARLDERLASIEDSFAHWRPKGAITAGKITPEQERYYTLHDHAEKLGTELEQLYERYEQSRLARLDSSLTQNIGKKTRYRAMKIRERLNWTGNFGSQPASSQLAAQSLEEAMSDLFTRAEPEAGNGELLDLERQLALLHVMANAPMDDVPVYLWIRGYPEGPLNAWSVVLAANYLDRWAEELHLEGTRIKDAPGLPLADQLLMLKGTHARTIAEFEAGTHLFSPPHGNMVPVRVCVLREWPAPATVEDTFPPIIRLYSSQGAVDLRTGIVAPKDTLKEALATMTLATLPPIPDHG